MGYVLGVDLGTTWTAAAIARDGRAEMLSLGNRSAAIPSVLFLAEEGTVLTGDAANRRAITDPTRVAREFKRRVGDPTPLLIGGSPRSAESLMAGLLRSVVQLATEREGSPPDHVAVSHPANWGPYKLDLLKEALRLAEQPHATTLTEPEAAALSYASAERVPVGALIAVYDLGGGTFDTAILRKTESDSFEILGNPEGIERLGGVDFDEAVFGYVATELEDVFDELDPDDPDTVAAVARLRQECIAAKEALSEDTQVTIPVTLPGVSRSVTLTRADFEAMIRPALAETIPALQRALASAGVSGDDLHAVLLVGGSSRMPLVAALVGQELGQRVATDVHPKHSVALGAALAAEADLPNAVTRMTGTPVSKRVVTTGPSRAAEPGDTKAKRPWVVVAGVAALAVVLVGAVFAVMSGRGDDNNPAASPTTVATATSTTYAGNPTATIESIALTEDLSGYPVYAITYRIDRFERYDPNGTHVHFFWDTTGPQKATAEAGADAFWGEPFEFDGKPWSGFNPGGKPDGALEICVLVAIEGHRVIPGTGNCMAIPTA